MSAGPSLALVCTTCAGPLLDRESFLECDDCGARYEWRGGVPCFKPSPVYHGEIPQAVMRRLLDDGRREGWRKAYDRAVAARTSREEYVLSARRAKMLELLPLRGDERVLDFGCGLGAITFALAGRVREVVALDAVWERVAFVDLRARQEGRSNVIAVCCGDPLEMPFNDEAFDLVVVNGVLEYIPLAVREEIGEAQRLALEQLARVLVPGGRLYLAIENRWAYTYFLGYPDHNGLRFTSLLPRRIASLVERLWKGSPYRVATHGLRAYRRLLARAGFAPPKVYWPAPLYQFPEAFVALDDRAALARYVRSLPAERPKERVKRAALSLLERLGALPYLVPDYSMLAEKAPHGSPA